MMIINAGIKRVVCEKRYHADEDTRELFKQASVELTVVNDKVEEYDQQ
jgi:dCMP deaminase